MFEIVYHTLAVKIIHHNSKKIPVQSPSKTKVLCLARYVCDGYDFFKRDDLYRCYDPDDIYMTGKQADKKRCHHH